LNHSVVCTLI